jgi:hypothetical protein
VEQQSNSSLGSLIVEVSGLHTIRHTLPVGLPWSSDKARRRSRNLNDTQQTQETNIHALSGARHRDPCNQAPSDRMAIGIGFVNITHIKFRAKCVYSDSGYLY